MNKVLFILHQKSSDPGDIGNKFLKRGYTIEVRRPPLGDNLPDRLSDYRAIVIFGGPMSANDQNEFIKNEINWIKKVIESKVPFLGICLGAQILAKYLGCKIEKNINDLAEIGFYKINPTEKGSKLFKKQNIFYQFHTEGFQIPSGCDLLAKGDIFNNQAFKYKNCFGLQFHPEVHFTLHLRWIFRILLKKPRILFLNGAQNIFYQFFLRIKYNKSISEWLDNFLDQYFLAHK